LDARNVCANVAVLCVAVAGDWLVAGCSDGSLQWFDLEKARAGHAKPKKIDRNAHPGGVTGLCFLRRPERPQLVSSGADGKVRLWKGMNSAGDVLLSLEEGRVCVAALVWRSEDKDLVLVGTESGKLLASDTAGGMVGELEFGAGAITGVHYVEQLHQVFATTASGALVGVCLSLDARRGAALFPGQNETRKQQYKRAGGYKAEVYSYEELLAGGAWKETITGNLRPVTDGDVQKRVERLKEMQRPNAEITDAAMVRAHQQQRDPRIALAQYQDQGTVHSDSLLVTETKEDAGGEGEKGRKTVGRVEELLRKRKNYCPRCGLKLCICGFMQIQEEQDAKKAKG
jgi:hypothetical protein